LAALTPTLLLVVSPSKPITLVGSVMKADTDPTRWFPIPGVEVGDLEGLIDKGDISDRSGQFRLPLKPAAKMGQVITLRLRKEGYQSADKKESIGEVPLAEYLVPLTTKSKLLPPRARIVLAADIIKEIVALDVVLRPYSRIADRGVPDSGKPGSRPMRKGGGTCSPDGKWKAAVNSVTLKPKFFTELRYAT
jgi:hypothetical protein